MQLRRLQELQSSSTLYWLLLLIHCLLLLLPTVSASCKEHVKKYCGNMACQQGLMTMKLEMHESCRKLRTGVTDECDAECEGAIVDLLNVYNGSEGLFTCNCTDTQMFYGRQDCELDRARLSSCPPLVALFNLCFAASQDCEADTTCKARFDAYLESCNPEQADPDARICSQECTGALEALRAQQLASNFWECSCDDTPEEWCRTSPRVYYEFCQEHIANQSSTSGSPEVPYKPLTAKPTSPPASKDETTQRNEKKGPGNSAPSTNIQSVYRIGLVVSVIGLLCYML